jgi:hypothetical protein
LIPALYLTSWYHHTLKITFYPAENDLHLPPLQRHIDAMPEEEFS